MQKYLNIYRDDRKIVVERALRHDRQNYEQRIIVIELTLISEAHMLAERHF